MLNYYWKKVREADRRWHAVDADEADSNRSPIPPSLEISIAILLTGAAVCFIGGLCAGWWSL